MCIYLFKQKSMYIYIYIYTTKTTIKTNPSPFPFPQTPPPKPTPTTSDRSTKAPKSKATRPTRNRSVGWTPATSVHPKAAFSARGGTTNREEVEQQGITPENWDVWNSQKRKPDPSEPFPSIFQGKKVQLRGWNQPGRVNGWVRSPENTGFWPA